VVPIAVFIATWWLYTPSILWLQMFASGLIAFIGAGTDHHGVDGRRCDGLRQTRMRPSPRGFVLRLQFLDTNSAWLSAPASGSSSLSGSILIPGGHPDPAHDLHDPLPPRRDSDHRLILAMVALARFPLSQERMAEIRLQLEARRGKV